MIYLSLVLEVGLLSLKKNSLPHSPCTALSPPHPQEYLWLRLPLRSHLLFICVLYHPPNSDDSIYISLSVKMDQLLSTHPNSLFLICGDINCHHASWLGVGSSLTSHSVGIFVMKKRIRVFFLLKAKTHLILLDDTINMKKN